MTMTNILIILIILMGVSIISTLILQMKIIELDNLVKINKKINKDLNLRIQKKEKILIENIRNMNLNKINKPLLEKTNKVSRKVGISQGNKYGYIYIDSQNK